MEEAKAKHGPLDTQGEGTATDIVTSFREYCALQRKFLLHERDTAKTPDAKLLRIGELRMLNNVESQVIQLGTVISRHPAPKSFPRTFDELSAILLDYYDLPRTFPVRDLLNERWRFQFIKDHPQQKGPILTLNRYAREKDLMNAILQVLHDTFPDLPPSAAIKLQPATMSATPMPSAKNTPVPGEAAPKEGREGKKARGRQMGEGFEERFICRCGKSFKYEARFNDHMNSCPTARKTSSGRKGRKEGQTFITQFACLCGRVFKYKKAFESHKETCTGRRD